MILYNDLAASQVADGRLMDTPGTEADRLLALMKADKVDSQTLVKADTMRRYLSMGRRLNNPRIKEILYRWEALKKRAVLVDYLTTLRQAGMRTTQFF